MVPKGWEYLTLESICKPNTPITYGVLKPGNYVPNGVPLLQIKDLLSNFGELKHLHRISPELDQEYKRSKIRTNDILISLVGTVGRIGLVPEALSDTNIHRNLGRIRTKYFEFITHYLKSDIAKNRIGLSSSGSSQSALNLSVLRALKVPIPPLPEQRKIAKILSTWDKAISTTERLIDNSKQQKKALMQQLLTGKKRLLDDSGKLFEGEWEWCILDKVCDVKGGKRLPKGESLTDVPNKHPYIRVTNMYMGGVKLRDILYVPEEVAPSIKNYTVNKNDLFITVAGTLGIVGEIPQALDGANLTENADKLTNISCDKKFLLYVLKSPIIQRYVEAESTQNAQPKLALQRIRNFRIPLPSIKEQQKIASVLTNADKEIELLEQQFADLKQEKKALMQQLLTGKRRVKVDEKEVA